MIETFEEFKEVLKRADTDGHPEDLAALFAEGLDLPQETVDDLLKCMRVRTFPASGAMVIPILLGLVAGAALLNDNPIVNDHAKAVYRLSVALDQYNKTIIPEYEGNHPLADQSRREQRRRGSPRGYEDTARLATRLLNAMMEYLTGETYWYKMSDYKTVYDVSGTPISTPTDFGSIAPDESGAALP